MDVVEDIVSRVPLRHLSDIFTIFKLFWQNVQSVQVNQEQFRVLAYCIAQLLQTLDQEYRVGHLAEHETFTSLEGLRKLLTEIAAFVRRETTHTFLHSLLNKDDTISRIEVCHGKIVSWVRAFQLLSLLDMGRWQSNKDDARKTDQQKLHNMLHHLEADQASLAEFLNVQDCDPMPIVVCLQRRLNDQSDIQQFLSHTLQYLNTWNGFSAEVENWMITSYEVEFGQRIGFGGFGEVYKGIWNKADVAIKVLRTDCGITPSPAAIRREIEIWSKMRHANILQFLGANEWGDRPFIVMPYLKNGNARDYVRAYPNYSRLKIIHHVSLGLVYLHGQNIVHGDLKALNVLMDDGGNAVLCDFGLSRIRADVTTRSSTHDTINIVGSRNWLAPEILVGGTPKRPGDIYAFGMTTYEIFVDDVPLGGLDYTSFIDLVVDNNVRPGRPDEEDALQLSDKIWKLAEHCWMKDARKRPTAKAVSDIISQLLETDMDTSTKMITYLVAPLLRPLLAVPPAATQEKLSSQQSLSSLTRPLPPALIKTTEVIKNMPIPISTMLSQHTVDMKSPALLSDSRTVSESFDGTILSDQQQPPSNSASIDLSSAHPSSPSPISDRAYAISATSCAACESPMQGAFVRALGSVFHLKCFKCMDCGDYVSSKFFPVDGTDGKQHPLCERDYFQRLNLICIRCNSALRGSYVTACSKKFHVEHFTCSICPILFGPKDSYYDHDGDVYCHFHYSTRFAKKCSGCSSAILKQYVKINRNMKDECWHPKCYMINKFWNVKIVSRKPNNVLASGSDASEPSYVEEEQRETHTSLKVNQVKMEQQVYRIWTVLSTFEESSAAFISDILRQFSNGQYIDAIRAADELVLHVQVLFAAIDDQEYHFASLNIKGMSHIHAARMLYHKTIDLFTLLSHVSETDSRRIGMTQELLALVPGLAHYTKILIRIALEGALRLEREQSAREAITPFLDKFHLLATQSGNPAPGRVIKGVGSGETSMQQQQEQGEGNPGTMGVTYEFRSLAPESAGEPPFTTSITSKDRGALTLARSQSINLPPLPSDLCVKCNLTIEEDCVRLGTYQRWHLHCIQCKICGKVAAVPAVKELSSVKGSNPGGKNREVLKLPTARCLPASVGLFVYEAHTTRETLSFGNVHTVILCTNHSHQGCRGGFQSVSRLEQYSFLLSVALRRLYLLLKKQGVIFLLPEMDSDKLLPVSEPDKSIMLSDIPQLMEAVQAREQPSLPRERPILHIAELSTLELTIVKYCAVLTLHRSPLRDKFDLDEILELVEMKGGSFWNKLFRGGDSKKNVKREGIFGVPLELLVERTGTDLLQGATQSTLRVPNFIDDILSTMRQMDMTIEGIFHKSGNIRQLKELTDVIDQDVSSVDLSMENPVQLAALLKKFLRDLPDSLMTFKLHNLYIASQNLPEEEDRTRILHMVLLLLPKAHWDTMEAIFVFLKWITSWHPDAETGNKMDLRNLATVICPSILYSRGRNAIDDRSFGAIRVVTSLLENQDELFTVPQDFLPILNDQKYFSNCIELPGKDFMKKCDTYMRIEGMAV